MPDRREVPRHASKLGRQLKSWYLSAPTEDALQLVSMRDIDGQGAFWGAPPMLCAVPRPYQTPPGSSPYQKICL